MMTSHERHSLSIHLQFDKQHFVQSNNKGIAKAMHYWSFVRETHRGPVDSFTKGQ